MMLIPIITYISERYNTKINVWLNRPQHVRIRKKSVVQK